MIGLVHITATPPGTFAGNVDWFINKHPDYAPHDLVDPSTHERRQFVDYSIPAKSLRNLPGGVETNRRDGGLYQVEIVAEAYAVGDYDDAWYAWLRDFLYGKSQDLGITYKFSLTGHRMTFAEWVAPLDGWFGHNEVPENDHPCPTNLDVSRLLVKEPMPELLIQSPNPGEAVLAVYSSGTLRHVGGDEAYFLTGKGVVLITEHDRAGYLRAVKASGTEWKP